MANVDDWLNRIGSAFSGSAYDVTSAYAASQASVAPGFGQVDASGNPYVYMGGRSRVAAGRTKKVGVENADGGLEVRTVRGRPQEITTDSMLSLAEAQSLIWAWEGTPKLDEWAQLLVDEGVIEDSERNDIQVLNQWWQQAIEWSTNFQAAGKRYTPQQALKIVASGTGSTPSKSLKSTSVQVDLSSASEAKSLIVQAFQQRMGRNPTDAEVRTLTNTLNDAQRANPINTTTTYSADGTTSSSVRSGGLDAGQYLDDKAMAMPDYAEYQAAATYMPAFEAAIGTIGGN